MDKTSSSNRPVETLRDGRLKATVWEQQGDNGPYHSVTLARTYEDKNGKLQDTNSFSPGELLRVAELARESHALVRDLRREQSRDRQADRQADQYAERNPAPARDEPVRDGRPNRFRDQPEPGLGR